jgi:hypothetical protein
VISRFAGRLGRQVLSKEVRLSATPLKLTLVDGLVLDAVIHESVGRASVGTVVQAHGVTVDLDEGGMFVRLANRISRAGRPA